MRANARFHWEKPHRYDGTTSSGSVVYNDPVNGRDPSGEGGEIVVTAGCGIGCTVLTGRAAAEFLANLRSIMTASRLGPALGAIVLAAKPTELGSDDTCAQGCDEGGEYTGETPDDRPDDFKDLGPSKGHKSKPREKKSDGSIWEKDKDGHGGSKWKRWDNERAWRDQRGRQSVRPDGTTVKGPGMANDITAADALKKIEYIKTLWPRDINVQDKILFSTGGAKINALVKVKDEIEDNLEDGKDVDSDLSIIWAIYTIAHDISKKVDVVRIQDISNAYILEVLKENSGWNVS